VARRLTFFQMRTISGFIPAAGLRYVYICIIYLFIYVFVHLFIHTYIWSYIDKCYVARRPTFFQMRTISGFIPAGGLRYVYICIIYLFIYVLVHPFIHKYIWIYIDKCYVARRPTFFQMKTI